MEEYLFRGVLLGCWEQRGHGWASFHDNTVPVPTLIVVASLATAVVVVAMRRLPPAEPRPLPAAPPLGAAMA